MYVYGTDPTDPAGLSPQTVATLDGVDYLPAESFGEWAENGDAVYAVEGRGHLGYALSVAEAGIHDLDLTTGVYDGGSDLHAYDYSVWIDDVFVERVTVPAGETGVYTRRILTPWLPAGTHALRVELENTLTGRQVQLHGLALGRTGGPDADQNGVADWMDTVLADRNGVGTPDLASVTSPFSLEGRARFLGFLEADGGALEAQPAPYNRFHLEVPLDPAAPVSVPLAFENAGLAQTVSLSWEAFPLTASAEPLILRKGDTLRAVLDTPESVVTDVTYAVDGTTVAQAAPGVPVTHLFDAAGVYTLTATADTATGTLAHGVQVDVREAELGEPFTVLETSPAPWTPPLFGDALALEVDDDLVVTETTEEGNPRSFGVQGNVPEVRYLAARTFYQDEQTHGRLLDTVAVRALRVASNDDVHAKVDTVFADGTELISVGIVLDQVPEDLQVHVNIFVAGVTFTDGTVDKILTAADFDEYGRASFQFLKSPDVDNSICHRLHISVGGTYLGTN